MLLPKSVSCQSETKSTKAKHFDMWPNVMSHGDGVMCGVLLKRCSTLPSVCSADRGSIMYSIHIPILPNLKLLRIIETIT